MGSLNVLSHDFSFSFIISFQRPCLIRSRNVSISPTSTRSNGWWTGRLTAFFNSLKHGTCICHPVIPLRFTIVAKKIWMCDSLFLRYLRRRMKVAIKYGTRFFFGFVSPFQRSGLPYLEIAEIAIDRAEKCLRTRSL